MAGGCSRHTAVRLMVGFVSLLNAIHNYVCLVLYVLINWLMTQDYYALVKICPAVLLMGKFYDVSVKSRQLLERILNEPDLERRNLLRTTALNRTLITIGVDITGHAICVPPLEPLSDADAKILL